MARNGSDVNRSGIEYTPIGYIRTPYKDWAPHQPVEQEKGVGKFRLVIDEEYSEGFKDLDRFEYIIILYHLDKVQKESQNIVSPPWAKGKKVGLFASRSPVRPNGIGMSIVRIAKIEGNQILTWPLDVFDNTPLLDIKPYIGSLDCKKEAGDGWIDDLEGAGHVLDHLRGIEHDHSHDHSHSHGHHDHHHHHNDSEKKK